MEKGEIEIYQSQEELQSSDAEQENILFSNIVQIIEKRKAKVW